jgi:8-oxo-dGTP pyrophosphatase MutT (NUDIX family)
MKVLLNEEDLKYVEDSIINGVILKEDLKQWFKEKWVDVSKKVDGKHPPCGRNKASDKSYPKCRPKFKVSKSTPKLAGSFTKDEKKKITKIKRNKEKKHNKIGKGNKPVLTKLKENHENVDYSNAKASVGGFIYNNRILIVKRSETDYWMPNKWGLVGGMIEPNESPLDALIRECFEEVHLTPYEIKKVNAIKDKDDGYIIYYTGLLNNDDVILSYEHSDYAFIEKHELDNYEFVPNAKLFLEEIFNSIGNINETKIISLNFKNNTLNESTTKLLYINELISDGLKYHINSNKPLSENIYRIYSKKFFDLINESRDLYNKGLLNLINEDIELLNTDIGKKGIYEGKVVYLDIPFIDEYDNHLVEAKHHGKNVKLNRPFRTPGGPKKFAVYVKTPKGTIKKVTFGDPNLRVRNNNPKAAKSFRARHKCEQKNDRTKAGYWSCNISRYRKVLGLKSSRSW